MITLPGVESSERIRSRFAETGDPVLLGFSRGKDSIAAWLALQEAGVRVIPFHLYRVPGIRFEEESLAYFEDFFGQRILQLPHPALFRWLREFVYQPPERAAIIDAAELPRLDYPMLLQMLREDYAPSAWYADGVRACDSPIRRVAIQKYGAAKSKDLKAHVVWDWQIADVREKIAEHGVRLPPDYDWFGRSFDGIDRRFLEPLSRFAPDDYQTVLEWFPFAELEVIWRG